MAMSRVSERCRPTDHVCADAILRSGAKPFSESARLARTGIGNVGFSLNGALPRRFVWLSRIGHDSPGPTRLLLFALLVRLIVLPGFAPNVSVNTAIPCRS